MKFGALVQKIIFLPKASESFSLTGKTICNCVFKGILANLVAVFFVCLFFPLIKYEEHM